jgi:Tfp pilus assembly protein PilF
LALLCCDQGRWKEAEQWLARARQDPPAPPATYQWFARLDATVRLTAYRGQLEEAVVLARPPTELTDDSDRLNQRAQAWLTLAHALRTTGRTTEADVALASAISLYERKGNLAALTRLRAGEPLGR